MKKILFVFIFLASFSLSARELPETSKGNAIVQISRIGNEDVTFQLPKFIFSHTNTRVIVKFKDAANAKLINNNFELNFIVNGADQKVFFDNTGTGFFYCTFKENGNLNVLIEDVNYSTQASVISIWYMLTPLLILLVFFIYKIAVSIRKGKTPTLVVKHNSQSIKTTNVNDFTSQLKVVRVREVEEV